MKNIKTLILLMAMFASTIASVSAQEIMYLLLSDSLMVKHYVSDIDSIVFTQPEGYTEIEGGVVHDTTVVYDTVVVYVHDTVYVNSGAAPKLSDLLTGTMGSSIVWKLDTERTYEDTSFTWGAIQGPVVFSDFATWAWNPLPGEHYASGEAGVDYGSMIFDMDGTLTVKQRQRIYIFADDTAATGFSVRQGKPEATDSLQTDTMITSTGTWALNAADSTLTISVAALHPWTCDYAVADWSAIKTYKIKNGVLMLLETRDAVLSGEGEMDLLYVFVPGEDTELVAKNKARAEKAKALTNKVWKLDAERTYQDTAYTWGAIQGPVVFSDFATWAWNPLPGEHYASGEAGVDYGSMIFDMDGTVTVKQRQRIYIFADDSAATGFSVRQGKPEATDSLQIDTMITTSGAWNMDADGMLAISIDVLHPWTADYAIANWSASKTYKIEDGALMLFETRDATLSGEGEMDILYIFVPGQDTELQAQNEARAKTVKNLTGQTWKLDVERTYQDTAYTWGAIQGPVVFSDFATWAWNPLPGEHYASGEAGVDYGTMKFYPNGKVTVNQLQRTYIFADDTAATGFSVRQGKPEATDSLQTEEIVTSNGTWTLDAGGMLTLSVGALHPWTCNYAVANWGAAKMYKAEENTLMLFQTRDAALSGEGEMDILYIYVPE